MFVLIAFWLCLVGLLCTLDGWFLVVWFLADVLIRILLVVLVFWVDFRLFFGLMVGAFVLGCLLVFH